MVLSGDVPERSGILSHRRGGLLSGKKPRRRAEVFQLYHYAYGIICVITFFSTEEIFRDLRQVCISLAIIPDQPSERSISSGEAVNYTGIGILLLYLLVFTVAASWFIYKKKNL